MSAHHQKSQHRGIWLATPVLLAGLLLTSVMGTALAQTDNPAQDPHAGNNMGSMSDSSTENSHMEGEMSGMTMPEEMDMEMDMGSMQGGSPPDDARDPHAYSGGYVRGAGAYALPGGQKLQLADEHHFGMLLVDRLEAVRTSNNTATAYDLQAWYGGTYNRAVFKAEGVYDDGEFKESSNELLWGHAITAFWDTQLGVRHDSGAEGPDRNWLAFGVQGLAPYWFEIDATAYVGEEGRTALSMEAEYELLLTQKWILQPRIEAAIHGKDDDERGIGSGLTEVAAGVRLRYEIRREFAPYVGVEWAGKFGDTKDLAQAAGEETSETRWVAGLRFWF